MQTPYENDSPFMFQIPTPRQAQKASSLSLTCRGAYSGMTTRPLGTLISEVTGSFVQQIQPPQTPQPHGIRTTVKSMGNHHC
jgi:hypothetical protein